MTHINIFLNLNSYEVIGRIGKGTYSKVCKVKDKSYGNIYAAKVSDSPVDDEQREESTSFFTFSEVNVLSALNHKAILKFIGYSSTDFHKEPNPTIIMEFAPNKSLYNVISNSSSIDSWNDTKKLINIYGIAAGMNYLHLNDIVHCDLKPENILMDANLQPKISDFGSNKMKNFAEKFNIKNLDPEENPGTLIYMPPESCLEDYEVNSSCDVYAYGLIVYQILEDKPYL